MSPTQKIKHLTENFDSRDGARLFRQSWYPAEKPRAVVIIVHGIAEHSGRYAHVAECLCQNRIAVETFDLRGHGQSEGERIYIDRFSQFLNDLEHFILEVRRRYPSGPLYLLGHSMGGAIVTDFILERHVVDLSGILLSSPAVKVGRDVPGIVVALSSVISLLLPHQSTVTLDSAGISRDPVVVQKYDSDPLNFRGAIPARTGAELIKTQKYIMRHAEKFTYPVLVMYGTGDTIVEPEGSKLLFNKIQSEDKTLKAYDGFYHEILNDPEKQRVLDDMLEWLNDRLPAEKPVTTPETGEPELQPEG
ncbi:MAG: lysophospholipase [Candidatus Marinimicrobia bacterium]|nr:lysophospholipase [Candidatus Neomarinimicrobiota bacterium]MCF7840506.1 lysophospholipase [Candidatus Neomarinimicrobiota bacterium]